MVYNYVFRVLVKLTQIERGAALVLVDITANLNLMRQALVGLTDLDGLLPHIIQKNFLTLLAATARCWSLRDVFARRI